MSRFAAILFGSRPTFAAVSLPLLLSIGGCASSAAPEVANDPAAQVADEDLLKKTGQTSEWSYNGVLPELESPKLTVSLAGHTVHVQGLIPTSFKGALPFYVKTEDVAGRKVLHVAYPIATVGVGGTTESGLPTRNPEPFAYNICGGDNFHATNSIGSFGGFPFIQYVCNHKDFDGRIRDGIAFHGPITAVTADGIPYWSLLRGPVSHACNRMLGEHVLELAKLTGFSRSTKVKPPVTVIKDFDRFGGKKVDVDYPATKWTRPAAAESVVFPIWQAVKLRADGTTELQFPKWACEESRCAKLPPNAYDPATGKPLAK
jgi:hypothetical protein